jgi:acyl-CoA reductase-like NAD-dependent aldehyde dehydrogenase
VTTLTSVNPATGQSLGAVERTPPDAIDRIVARARGAQGAWGDTPAADRCNALLEAGRRFSADAERLACLITAEMGKPLAEARLEVRSLSAGLEEHLAEMRDAIEPEVIRRGNEESVIHRDPLGVCAAITPWNFPMSMPSWMVFPALATGNAVVFKPSEETPLCGQAFANVLLDVLPPDLLQLVHGAEEEGRALVGADVDLIAFTGSRAVGKEILAVASAGLKRVILELGGKDPMIVLADADLEAAAAFAAYNTFRNAGQVCISTERIFVAESVAARFEDLLVAKTAALVLGDGREPGTHVGPMVNARQKKHVLALIEEAVARGATLRCGGTEERGGNFVAPTVLTEVTDDMAVAREETFGPVACVTRVADSEEALRRANATRYGLGAVVFGGDPSATERVARRVQAGMVGINRTPRGVQGTPWVGIRESGYGFHMGRDGHRQFTQTRVVTRSCTAR